MLRSCSRSPGVASGVLGDPRKEFEPSAGVVCFATNPGIPTGGVEELARASLPFSSWAFSSAALAFIWVGGRGGVGVMG